MDTQASRIVKKFGSQAELARAAGKSKQVVNAWVRVGWIPAHCQAEVLAAARAAGIELTMDDWFPNNG